MTPDELLPATGVSANWHGTYIYKYNSSLSSTTETVYSLYHIVNAGFVGGTTGVYSIKVIHSSNTWDDYGSDIPDDPPTVNGNNIELYNGSTLQYAFVKPTTADWISSGSGTGTLSNTGAISASFPSLTATHFTWKVRHNTTAPSQQTYELHSTTLTPTFIQDMVVGPNAGDENSSTMNWTTPDTIEIRKLNGTVLASLSFGYPTQKKVFCNFW